MCLLISSLYSARNTLFELMMHHDCKVLRVNFALIAVYGLSDDSNGQLESVNGPSERLANTDLHFC